MFPWPALAPDISHLGPEKLADQGRISRGFACSNHVRGHSEVCGVSLHEFVLLVCSRERAQKVHEISTMQSARKSHTKSCNGSEGKGTGGRDICPCDFLCEILHLHLVKKLSVNSSEPPFPRYSSQSPNNPYPFNLRGGGSPPHGRG